MSSSRNALGKGIGALIPTGPAMRRGPTFFLCPIDRISPMKGQPRRDFDEERLAELAQSIEESGVLQPVLVRQRGLDYELIAGERRWRAARIAGLSEIPAVVKETSDTDAFALALVENIQREDLSPLEMAEALRRLIDEYSFTQEALAQRLGKSRSAIANTLRLLKLDAPAQSALLQGRVSEGHARQLVGLDADAQQELLDTIVAEQLSVRETEARARRIRHGEPEELDEDEDDDDVEEEVEATPKASSTRHTSTSAASGKSGKAKKNPELEQLRERLELALGTRVQITDRKGVGQIIIDFDSYAILEGIEEQILG